MKLDYLYYYYLGKIAEEAKDINLVLEIEKNKNGLVYTSKRSNQRKVIHIPPEDYKKNAFIFLGHMIQEGYYLRKTDLSQYRCKQKGSQTSDYLIDLEAGTCTCKNFIWKNKNQPDFKCKHIEFTKIALKFSEMTLGL